MFMRVATVMYIVIVMEIGRITRVATGKMFGVTHLFRVSSMKVSTVSSVPVMSDNNVIADTVERAVEADIADIVEGAVEVDTVEGVVEWAGGGDVR
jgi:hypothetical protein